MWTNENKIDDTRTAPCPPKKDFSRPLKRKPLNKISSNIGPRKTTPKYSSGKLWALL